MSKLSKPGLFAGGLAAGVMRHHEDDRQFHATRAFAELSLELAVLFRDALPGDEGFRPHFLGHIAVELLLDSALIAAEPARLDAYYAALAVLDRPWVAGAVSQIAGRDARDLATFIELFERERFLADYADDVSLRMRLNQVMRRVRLPSLPQSAQPSFRARSVGWPANVRAAAKASSMQAF